MVSKMPARLRPEDLAGLSEWNLVELFRALENLAYPGFGDDPFVDRCYAAFGADRNLVHAYIFDLPPGSEALACKVITFLSDEDCVGEVGHLVSDAFDLLSAPARTRG
ncbi:hypothetical protein PVW47_01475 [Marinovum sp. SP66]|uniref:hypothetical protein n=1 Tax=Marinovum TaxID=367771 RepID=UPI00237B45D6|nr:hypothetical protein [Marinovum sp. SP66]MDD9738443.1 hypothetical protein [Marinovum sp. SP66]